MSTETPAAVDPLMELVNAFKAALNPTPPPLPASGCPMAVPATFSGEAAECSGFLLQVNLYIQMQLQQFTSENAKVAFLISLLTAQRPAHLPLQISFSDYNKASSVNEYTLHFRTLEVASSWNEVALLGAYWQGLNPEIHTAMALYDDSIGLESFLQRATRVSQRLAACQLP
ncbi:hypothetical protein M9458_007750, partial [Cirrhinus mrigala]